MHVKDDIRSSNELTLDEYLRKRWPVAAQKHRYSVKVPVAAQTPN